MGKDPVSKTKDVRGGRQGARLGPDVGAARITVRNIGGMWGSPHPGELPAVTIEDIFGLPHLGDAAMPQVRSFGPDVYG